MLGGWGEVWEGCLADVVGRTGKAFCLLVEIPLQLESSQKANAVRFPRTPGEGYCLAVL